MENRIEDNKTEIIVNQGIGASMGLPRSSIDLPGTNKAIENLITEGGESFYNYVDRLGLIKDQNLIILSSVHHYYFDTDDFKDVNTIINVKQLNLIKNINGFFHSILKIIPAKSNFIGCFLDSKTQKEYAIKNSSSQYKTKRNVDPFENEIISRIPFLNMVYNLVDSKTNRYLTRRNVSFLLEEQGFKVLDMTDLNRLTYFHSQKVKDFDN